MHIIMPAPAATPKTWINMLAAIFGSSIEAIPSALDFSHVVFTR
jgi:hypothetical protein